MKYNLLLLAFLFPALTFAAHVSNRPIYATDVKNATGQSVVKFPSVAPSATPSGVPVTYNADGEMVPGSYVPVQGPGSATDGYLVSFQGTSGKLIKNGRNSEDEVYSAIGTINALNGSNGVTYSGGDISADIGYISANLNISALTVGVVSDDCVTGHSLDPTKMIHICQTPGAFPSLAKGSNGIGFSYILINESQDAIFPVDEYGHLIAALNPELGLQACGPHSICQVTFLGTYTNGFDGKDDWKLTVLRQPPNQITTINGGQAGFWSNIWFAGSQSNDMTLPPNKDTASGLPNYPQNFKFDLFDPQGNTASFIDPNVNYYVISLTNNETGNVTTTTTENIQIISYVVNSVPPNGATLPFGPIGQEQMITFGSGSGYMVDTSTGDTSQIAGNLFTVMLALYPINPVNQVGNTVAVYVDNRYGRLWGFDVTGDTSGSIWASEQQSYSLFVSNWNPWNATPPMYNFNSGISSDGSGGAYADMNYISRNISGMDKNYCRTGNTLDSTLYTYCTIPNQFPNLPYGGYMQPGQSFTIINNSDGFIRPVDNQGHPVIDLSGHGWDELQPGAINKYVFVQELSAPTGTYDIWKVENVKRGDLGFLDIASGSTIPNGYDHVYTASLSAALPSIHDGDNNYFLGKQSSLKVHCNYYAPCGITGDGSFTSSIPGGSTYEFSTSISETYQQYTFSFSAVPSDGEYTSIGINGQQTDMYFCNTSNDCSSYGPWVISTASNDLPTIAAYMNVLVSYIAVGVGLEVVGNNSVMTIPPVYSQTVGWYCATASGNFSCDSTRDYAISSTWKQF